MLNREGFDLWADGYDRSVGLSDEDGNYPFAGYRDILNAIYGRILSDGGRDVLDVGFGTGLVAAQAIKIIGSADLLTGVDPSPAMMGASPLAKQVRLVEGKAERIPLPDACADFISMGYALRHVSDVSAAFSEFHRVLKPGGRLCILEITKPEGALGNALLKGYMRGWVPLAARLSGSATHTPRIWRYYWDSIEACASPVLIQEALRAAGFQQVRRHVELGVFSEYQATKA